MKNVFKKTSYPTFNLGWKMLILMFICSFNLIANQQQKEVTGKVTDAINEPLPGVTIQVKGTTIGTISDQDGNYVIPNVAVDAVLVFSFVGMKSVEVNVGNRNVINVTLEEESYELGEVIAIGYGSQRKENLTGAVSNVGSNVLENRPITNVGQGLQGEISNLNVSVSSGAPGQGTSFNIRGTTSLSGGSPLVLVNGVSMDINQINPNDIDNITVLKDGASAAIYGARAAFGVILITTKSGKTSTKPSITLTTNLSTNSPTFLMDWFDSKQIVEWMDEAYLRTTGSPYYDDIERNAILAHHSDPSQPSSIIHPNNPNEWTNVANTDWNSILMQKAYPMHQHSLSISGGTERITYYTSLSYLYQKGIVNKDLFDERYNRYNFLTDLDYKILDWISLGARVALNISDKKFPPNDSWFRNSFPEGSLPYQVNTYATMALKDPNGNWSHIGSIHNLAQMMSEGGYQSRNIADFWLTGTLRLTPIEGMSVNLDYTFNPYEQRYMHYVKQLPFYDVDGNINAYYGGSNPSRVIRTNSSNQYYAFNVFGDYEKTIDDAHNFKIMLGFNQENANFLNVSAERRNLIVEQIPYMSLAYGEKYTDDSESHYAIRGVFGRLNYVYKNKYLFEINGRYDGSSRFPKADRFAFFPSASAGWRIDQEQFFQSITNTFDMLKVRVSYSSLGNQIVSGYYPYIATMGTSEANYLINGAKPMQVTAPGLVSPTLTWETVVQKNLGIDIAILNSRLSGNFDIYRRDTKNMLTAGVTLPSVLAVAEPQENAADLRTTGWDMNISWKDNVGQVKYGVSLILSDYKAVITKFDNPNGLFSDYYVGKDIGEIWGLVTGGIFQTDEEAQGYDATQIAARQRQAGDLWHVDLNGDGRITYGSSTLDDPGDRKIIGNSTPRYSFGFRSNVEWKGFDLQLFFQGVGKRDRWMSTQYWLNIYAAEWTPRPTIMLDYWSPDNRDAQYPRPIRTGTGDITAVQTRFLQNAAYIRLKQLTLGYTIPAKITQKINMNKIHLFLSGNNLWTGTKTVKIADPELGGPSAYPLYKTLSIGANINF